jgi:hypothetical protein
LFGIPEELASDGGPQFKALVPPVCNWVHVAMLLLAIVIHAFATATKDIHAAML